LALALFASNPLEARISRNLAADIRVGYSSTEQDSNSQENVDQEYNLSWQKHILRELVAKSAVRYYNFGASQNVGGNSWRSELQPSAEIIWNQSWFGVSAQGMRRDSKSNDRSSHLINESAGIAFRSQVARYPWVKARLQQENLYNRANLGDRDTRDRLASVGVGYNSLGSSVAYDYSHKNTLNRSQSVEQSSDVHVVQLDHMQTFGGGKIRSSVSYDFSYKAETDRNLAFDPFAREIPVFLGLFASDATPDIGGLDTAAALIDGNIEQPALPLIEIGGNRVNQNVGVDVGFSREVSILYVYTDRPSGNNVRWSVYQSGDNTIWEPVSDVVSNFSTGFSRYEISFPAAEARYIKAVNNGLNEVDSVYVTEVAALLRVADTGVSKRDQRVHLASLNNSFILAEDWSANANLSLRRDGGGTLSQGRDETYYSFGVRNQLRPTIAHNARLQVGFIDYESSRVDVDKIVSANYDIQYHPLQTLEFSLSLIHRDSYIESVKSQELNYAVARMRGDLLPRLAISNEFTGGRNTLMQSNTGFDTWSYRSGLIGRATSKLDVSASYFHQRVRDLAEVLRVKNQYDLTVGYLVTDNIQVRGNVNLTKDDRTQYVSQDYSFSWQVSKKLSAGAAISLSDYENGVDSRSEHYSAQLEYSLTGRTVLSGSYSENDLESAGGNSNRSVRVGIRTGL
ncbi:MAG: hypothetical protein WBP29_13400, partial [Candidatus Zixiibacteriota bacterium]